MNLLVQIPPTYGPERTYIIQVILDEFLGLEYQLEVQERQDTRITSSDGKELILADEFFQTPENRWLTPQSLPRQPLGVWDLGNLSWDIPLNSPNIPIIYGYENPGSHQLFPGGAQSPSIVLTVDILGSIFFMLTRYEELVKTDRDGHGRFPAAASLAYQEGFLDRPIVNEYLEILWWYLKRLWPFLKRKNRAFRVLPSHDVDSPFDLTVHPPLKLVGLMARNAVKRRQPLSACQSLWQWLKMMTVHHNKSFDPFVWTMDQSEQEGWCSAFYFMAGRRDTPEGTYALEHPFVQERIRLIENRGHEIGFHPSYASALKGDAWRKEFKHLQAHSSGAKIKGGRQHFLRFHIPRTWSLWAEADLEYDSSLAFADHVGFRSGTCYEHLVYDLQKREVIPLHERPLVAMDSTVIDRRYMGLGAEQAAQEAMSRLKERCRLFGGDFTLLWHNHRMVDPREMELYRALISARG